MFLSNSKLLKQKNVTTAVMANSKIALAAHDFDMAHVESDFSPTNQEKKRAKIPLKQKLMDKLSENKIKFTS